MRMNTCVGMLYRFKNVCCRSEGDIIGLYLLSHVAGPSRLAAFERSSNILIHPPPLVALVTLRPVLYLILLTIHLQPPRRLVLLPNLPAVLGFQPLLLLNFVALVLLSLHLSIHKFLEIQKLLRLGNARQFAALEVLEDLGVTGPHGGLAAPADPGSGQLREPVESGVVDGFGNVDSEIESAVVASAQDQHELPGPVLHLGETKLGVLLLEEVGIDEGGLVPEMLGTFAEMLGEEQARLFLEDVGLAGGDAVPKLTPALVEVVDGGKVEILPVPAEQRLPGSDVAIGSGDSAHVDVDGVVEHGVQFVEVPGAGGFVHEGVEQVGPVEGRREYDVLPKLPQFHGYHCLNFVGRESVGDAVEHSHLQLVLLVAHGLLLDVQAFVHAALPENVLLDRPVDHQMFQLLRIVRRFGLPFSRRDHLDYEEKKDRKQTEQGPQRWQVPSPFRIATCRERRSFRRSHRSS